MHDKIKELAEQAGLEYNFDPMLWLKQEKFAELIVRECIGCCEQAISDPVPESVDTWLNGGSQCIDQIKQHFGVKE